MTHGIKVRNQKLRGSAPEFCFLELDEGGHLVACFRRRKRGGVTGGDIEGSQACLQERAHGAVDSVCFFEETEGVPEHHAG